MMNSYVFNSIHTNRPYKGSRHLCIQRAEEWNHIEQFRIQTLSCILESMENKALLGWRSREGIIFLWNKESLLSKFYTFGSKWNLPTSLMNAKEMLQLAILFWVSCLQPELGKKMKIPSSLISQILPHHHTLIIMNLEKWQPFPFFEERWEGSKWVLVMAHSSWESLTKKSEVVNLPKGILL